MVVQDGPGHSTNVRSGFPFSTTYVASSAALPVPTFLTAWIAPAGTVRASPGVERPRRLAFDLILQRPFKDVDDLFARMCVLDHRRFGADVDPRLNHLAPRDAEILP